MILGEKREEGKHSPCMRKEVFGHQQMNRRCPFDPSTQENLARASANLDRRTMIQGASPSLQDKNCSFESNGGSPQVSICRSESNRHHNKYNILYKNCACLFRCYVNHLLPAWKDHMMIDTLLYIHCIHQTNINKLCLGLTLAFEGAEVADSMNPLIRKSGLSLYG